MSNVDDPLEIMKYSIENLRSIQLTLKDESIPFNRKELSKTMDGELKKMEKQIDIEIQNRKCQRRQDMPMEVSNDAESGSDSEKRKSTSSSPSPSGYFSNFSNPFKSKPKKKVQIMNAVPTETTGKFITVLKKRTDTDCKLLGRKDVIDPLIPLIILCPNSSRLKPDVDLALEGTKLPQQCTMVIIHTGAESNLPSVPSAMKLSGYGGIQFLDMGFDHHYGIYDCNHNAQAFQQLHSFIDMFYPQQK